MSNVTEADIANCVALFNTALIKRDGEALRLLTDAAMSYGHSKGKIETREAFIENVLSDEATQFTAIEVLEQSICLSDDCAIVRHKLAAATSKKGVTGELNVQNLMVWRCVNKEWKLIARQAFTA